MTVLRLPGFQLDGTPRPVDLTIAYRTFGKPNRARNNCIVLPTYFTGRSDDCYDDWVGPEGLFDPQDWFIVVVDMFGNGCSSSPSNSPARLRQAFDAITIEDNVRAQRQLLATLGIEQVALVAGWSMGGMQALSWAANYPGEVAGVLSVCGTARCWPGNQAFLAGLEPFLALGRAGLGSFGRAYAGWAYSSRFLRDATYRELGAATLEQLLDIWAADHEHWHPDDLGTMLGTWRRADPGPHLEDITARTVLAPCSTDTYFTVAESRLEADRIPGAALEVIDSEWGHAAGRPGLRPEVTGQLRKQVRSLLTP